MGRGLQRFRARDARSLIDSGMMSMPVLDPPAVDEMMKWSASPGHRVRVLFGDPNENGVSLVWSWFAPNYALPRHSHSADCLYYVTTGSLRMGNQDVEAGDGFFVPAGAPYAYTAGPDGVEILEFRTASKFDMQITESLERWAQLVELARASHDDWERAGRAVATS